MKTKISFAIITVMMFALFGGGAGAEKPGYERPEKEEVHELSGF